MLFIEIKLPIIECIKKYLIQTHFPKYQMPNLTKNETGK